MTLKTQHEKPVYVRLREIIANGILSGKYRDGDPLPSVRALAGQEQANPLTVAKAYQGFQDEGLVTVKRGVGLFVATVGFSIGNIYSIRLSKLRGIQSAELMNTFACGCGSSCSLAKLHNRACSRKRPTIDFTKMFSDIPGTPGRRQQMPRTTRSIGTPAWLAS